MVQLNRIDGGWDNILDRGEKVIWQDRPDGSFALTPSMIGVTLFATGFTAFAVFWMLMASQAGGNFWMFGLIHFTVGAVFLVTSLFGPSFVRKRTHYSLTNKRAFIATDLPFVGRSLKSYPISAHTQIEFIDGPYSSIFFASEPRKYNRSGGERQVGFERIPNGQHVLRLIRDVQENRE